MSEALTETTQDDIAARMAAVRAAREPRAPKAPEAAPVASPVVIKSPTPDSEIELPAGPSLMERAAAKLKAQRNAKIIALRAARMTQSNPINDPPVRVRILKRGHGMVSMGEHVAGLGDLTYDAGETPDIPRSIALELEERGWLEIE